MGRLTTVGLFLEGILHVFARLLHVAGNLVSLPSARKDRFFVALPVASLTRPFTSWALFLALLAADIETFQRLRCVIPQT
jgi:hypothetical protein